MTASPAMLTTSYTSEVTPPCTAALDLFTEALNQNVRDLHERGYVVHLREVHETVDGRCLPQIRVDVRTRDNAASRPEVLDG